MNSNFSVFAITRRRCHTRPLQSSLKQANARLCLPNANEQPASLLEKAASSRSLPIQVLHCDEAELHAFLTNTISPLRLNHFPKTLHYAAAPSTRHRYPYHDQLPTWNLNQGHILYRDITQVIVLHRILTVPWQAWHPSRATPSADG